MPEVSASPDFTFDLSGKVALVTGAGQRGGEGIAKALARRGASVIVNDLIEERARNVADQIEQGGGKAVGQVFDVTDLASVISGVAAGQAALGQNVDILVNNAGNGGANPLKMLPFSQLAPEEWRIPIDVNLYGVMNCVHAVIGNMIEKRWGRIITISSGAGTAGLDIGVSTYGAGKGGAISLMRHLAHENGPHGITANSIALGMIREGDVPVLNELEKKIPVRRRGNPNDLGALCIYLASEEAAWFTGQTLQLNGGSTTS